MNVINSRKSRLLLSKAFPMVLQSRYRYGSIHIQCGCFGEAVAWCICPDLNSVHQTDSLCISGCHFDTTVYWVFPIKHIQGRTDRFSSPLPSPRPV